MVGSSLRAHRPDAVYLSSKQYDLRDFEQCQHMFTRYSPDFVIHLAAKVGGVKANTDLMGEFYRDNITINTNVLEASRLAGIRKVVSLLSTCVYPDDVSYPITEDQLHLGPPHGSNFGYAYAKRMLDVQTQAYRQQYGCNYICAIPNNLYGEKDNFDLDNGHVIPALIRKVYEAKMSGANSFKVWGDGSPLREFTYADDIAKILLFLLENYDSPEPVNIGNVKEYSIKQVVEYICDALNYQGHITWDTTKPNGQHKKPTDNNRLLDLGWSSENYTSLEEGLTKMCEWFTINYPNVRVVKV